MSITDGNSVLLLGAGASKPFNIPLGGELIEEIKKQLVAERKHFRLGENKHHVRSDDLLNWELAHEFVRAPIHYTLFSRKEGFSQSAAHLATDAANQLKKLLDLLIDQTSETIDDFIVQNPSYADLAKLGAAAVFFLRSYTATNEGIFCKPFER